MKVKQLRVPAASKGTRSRWVLFAALALLLIKSVAADDNEIFCEAESRSHLPFGSEFNVAVRFPDNVQHFNPYPMEEDVLDIEVGPGARGAGMLVVPGGLIVVCGVRSPSHPDGAGIDVLGLIAVPPAKEFLSRGEPVTASVPGFYQKGVVLHFVPDPRERSRRSRIARGVAQVAASATAELVVIGTGAGALAAGAATTVLDEVVFSDDTVDEGIPMVVDVQVSPRPGTAPEPEPELSVTTVVVPQPQSESKTEQEGKREQERDNYIERIRERTRRRDLLQSAAQASTSSDVQVEEDCISFNPNRLRVSSSGDDYILGHGGHRMMAFDDRDEAEQARRIMRRYGMNRSCYVGRPGPSLHYFLVGDEAPSGSMSNEDCLRFDPDRIEVSQARGNWRIVQGSRWLMNFDDKKDEAEKALAIIQRHGFNQSCYVGRPGPSMTYMRR